MVDCTSSMDPRELLMRCCGDGRSASYRKLLGGRSTEREKNGSQKDCDSGWEITHPTHCNDWGGGGGDERAFAAR